MREYSVDPFDSLRVSEIMAQPVETLGAGSSIDDAVRYFTAPGAPSRHKCYPVLDEGGRVVGMLARSDVLRWAVQGWPAGQTLRDATAGQELVAGYEDELAGQVADRMVAHDVSRIPILRRSDGGLAGLVGRRDLLRVRTRSLQHERERETFIRLRLRPRRQAQAAPETSLHG